MKIYPAYARTIAALAVRGLRPAAIGVLFSARWWYFDHVAKVCIRPDEWAPGRYEFGYLHAQHAVAVWGDEAEPAPFGELLIEIMQAGPALLWACDAAGNWISRVTDAYELGRQVDELTGGKLRERVRTAAARYNQAQVKALELDIAETQRALNLGRNSMPGIRQRQQAREMAELLFGSGPDAHPA